MIEFKKISDFPKGTLYNQLVDAYSFHSDCKIYWDKMWKEYDDFFYSNLDSIADKCGFITAIDGIAVGHISWDSRKKPNYISIGHNCIITDFKGKGYGKIQLQEAIRRILKKYDAEKIIVTTNELTLPAQKNYESVGFVKTAQRKNTDTPFAGDYIDYEMVLKNRIYEGERNEIKKVVV